MMYEGGLTSIASGRKPCAQIHALGHTMLKHHAIPKELAWEKASNEQPTEPNEPRRGERKHPPKKTTTTRRERRAQQPTTPEPLDQEVHLSKKQKRLAALCSSSSLCISEAECCPMRMKMQGLICCRCFLRIPAGLKQKSHVHNSCRTEPVKVRLYNQTL